VEHLFPEEIGAPDETEKIPVPPGTGCVVPAKDEGYLQAVDGNSLFSLGENHELVIQMIEPIGAFIVADQPLARVWGKQSLTEELQDKICNAFGVGKDRSPGQDLLYYLLEVSDMAVRALSPGINDPTTAVHCIDRLTQILLAFGRRKPPEPLRTEAGN